MGKDWLSWSSGGGGGGGASYKAKKRRSRECKEMEEAVAAPGCMCAVFNFWDLNHLPFTFPHHARPSLSPPDTIDDTHTLLQDKPSARKGLEAPRNSLELNEKILEAAASSSSSSTTIKYDENLNIPMGGIRIRTKTEDLITSSECSTNSPGTKPPNLVARLMGLDLLPESSGSPSSFSKQSISPSLTNSHFHFQGKTHSRESRQYLYSHDVSVSGTVSLPETPRVSSARKSDVDHHRLSLQSLKENIDVSILGGRRNSVEEISYARRIVKQVKDRVSRKVGVDITNTISTNRNDHLLVLNPSKKSALLRKVKEDSSSSNQSTPSCSPRLSFLDSKKKSQPLSTKTIKKNHDPQSLKVSLDVSKTESQVQPREKPQVRMSNCSIRDKKEEPFIRSNVSEKKYPKKTSPSKELLNISVPTLVVPKRKDLSLPITQFHDKQLAEESDAPSVKRCTQLPKCLSLAYKKEKLDTLIYPFHENIQTKCPSNNNYIQRILKRIGIDKATPVSLAKWYSQSHPLDPSIFHYLELFHPTGPAKISRRYHRKLVFDLVDELLVEILNSWAVTKGEGFCGSELIDILCKKVGGFPGANCQVLKDIDGLIEMDLQRLQMGKSYLFEDLESIAMDIESDIVEKLVNETTMIMIMLNTKFVRKPHQSNVEQLIYYV